MNRRKFLRRGSTLGIMSIAGCMGDSDPTPTRAETTTPKTSKEGPSSTPGGETTSRTGDTSPPATSTSTPDDESTPPPDTPTQDLIFQEGEAHSFVGEGTQETEFFDLDRGLMSLEYEGEDEGSFTAHLVPIDIEGQGDLVDDRLLVNRLAPIEGRLMNLVSGGTYLLDVDFDGTWSFEIAQPAASYRDVSELPVERSGNGPDYFGPIQLVEDALIHATQEGEGGFSVHSINLDGHWDVVVNDSGEVDNTRSFRDTGIAWISVYATNSWEASLYKRGSEP